jgi:hypothetical protein
MLIKECDGCRYLIRMIGVGLGVRCNHPTRRPQEGLIPVISTIDNCQIKETHHQVEKNKETK